MDEYLMKTPLRIFFILVSTPNIQPAVLNKTDQQMEE